MTLACMGSATAALAGRYSVSRVAGVPIHFASHQLCSAVFVAGLDDGAFYGEAIERQIAPMGRLIGHHVDRDKREVTTSLLGIAHSRAVYRGPLGCQIDHGSAFGPEPSPSPPGPRLLPDIADAAVVPPASAALRVAIDRAFVEPAGGPPRQTKAVVVVHDGHVIAERYAAGYGVDTPLIGWSATKSVINALIGILVRQGKLAVETPAATLARLRDRRQSITIDNLLRMTSGIDFGQSLIVDWTSAFDPSVQMEFDAPDMAERVAQASFKDQPGTRWTYTNGNTMLLARIVRDEVGGDAASVLRFAHRELFDKLGMAHVTLEFDDAGTPIGASHMWASARDWARFGLLYLHDGRLDSDQILPRGWADYSARLTPGSEQFGYGAGFWTNRGGLRGLAQMRVQLGMPPDSYMALGAQGQYVVVVPSVRLVVVRLGMAFTRFADIEAVSALVRETVAAVRAP